MACGYYSPTFAGNEISFVTDRGPLIGSRPHGRAPGFTQMRLATGRKINWRGPAEQLRRWHFIFRSMPLAEMQAREAFGNTVAGASFELAWPDIGTLYVVTFVGLALAFDPVETQYGFDWEDELEEQP